MRSPVWYKGIRFGTPLEAAWARTFDRIGVPWMPVDDPGPEPWQLVSFFLRASRQYVVVRPRIYREDADSLFKLAESLQPRLATNVQSRRLWLGDDPVPDLPLIIAGEDGAFYGIGRGTVENHMALARCLECRGGWYFLAAHHSWRCQCCHRGHGNAHISDFLHSPLLGWPYGEPLITEAA